MSDPNEPVLNDVGKEYVRSVLAAAKSPHASDSIKRIADVMTRLIWLESERDHLHAGADRATAELLSQGRELRQAREENEQLRQRIEEQDAAWGRAPAEIAHAAQERDRAVAEAAVLLDALTQVAEADSDVLTSEVARRMHQIAVAALIHKPLAAHAAAVLATCVAEREHEIAVEKWRQLSAADPMSYPPNGERIKVARQEAVDAYRAALVDH